MLLPFPRLEDLSASMDDNAHIGQVVPFINFKLVWVTMACNKAFALLIKSAEFLFD